MDGKGAQKTSFDKRHSALQGTRLEPKMKGLLFSHEENKQRVKEEKD
jgi:hypothetical protein